MSKALSAIVFIIVVIVILGSVAAFFMWGGLSDDKKNDDDDKKIVNIIPTAYFTGNSTGRVGDQLFFDANGSYDQDGYITNYVWDFGDGGNPVQYNASLSNHTFYQPGVFEINLTVFDNDNAKDSFLDEITIIPINYVEAKQAILLKRFDINEENETIPIEEFAESLLINITVTGASISGPIPEDAIVTFSITNSVGILIGNETIETRGQATTEFFFSKSDLVYKGDYEMVALCEQGALYLDYTIEVNYG